MGKLFTLCKINVGVCGGADLSLMTRLGVSRTALEAMVVVGYYAVMVLQAGLSLALLNHHFEIVLYCQKYSQKQSFSSLIVRSQY